MNHKNYKTISLFCILFMFYSVSIFSAPVWGMHMGWTKSDLDNSSLQVRYNSEEGNIIYGTYTPLLLDDTIMNYRFEMDKSFGIIGITGQALDITDDAGTHFIEKLEKLEQIQTHKYGAPTYHVGPESTNKFIYEIIGGNIYETVWEPQNDPDISKITLTVSGIPEIRNKFNYVVRIDLVYESPFYEICIARQRQLLTDSQ